MLVAVLRCETYGVAKLAADVYCRAGIHLRSVLPASRRVCQLHAPRFRVPCARAVRLRPRMLRISRGVALESAAPFHAFDATRYSTRARRWGWPALPPLVAAQRARDSRPAPKQHPSSARRIAPRLAAQYVPLLVSASVLVIATRPGSSGVLGLIALIPLFYTIHTAQPLASGIRGAIWGAVVAIALGLGLGEPVSHWAALVTLPLITGLYAAGGAALTQWIGFSPLVLGVGWIIVELIVGAAGLKLGLLAATQADGWLMSGLGKFFGYFLVAFAVACINASAALALRSLVSRHGLWSLKPGAGRLPSLFAIASWFPDLSHFRNAVRPRGPPCLATPIP